MSRASAKYGKSPSPKSSLRTSGEFSGLMRRSGLSSTPKKSGNLAVSFSSDTGGKNGSDLEKIEAEYIKNLQQQIYFLELEANYLRDQARKATEMQPKMTAEAEAMILKLRTMQSAMDELKLEVQRQEAGAEIMKKEKNRLASKLKAEEEARQRDKRLHLEEVAQFRKQLDQAEKEAARKEAQISQVQEELSNSVVSSRTNETNMQMLQNQIEQKSEQLQLATAALEEKRSDLLKTQGKLHEMEDRYYSSISSVQDRLVNDLREEIKTLRQKLKESEMSTNQDRYLRSKLSEDSSLLVKENAALVQQASEMHKQLEQEKALRESNSSRLSQNMNDMMVLKDREKQLEFELSQTKDELEHERNRLTLLMTQVTKQEKKSSSQEMGLSDARLRVEQLEEAYHTHEMENAQLVRDKMTLTDHVAELQAQLADKEQDVAGLRKQVLAQQHRLRELEHFKDVECTLHSQKWQEFSRLADSMKSLSHNMAHSCTARPPTLN